MTPRQATELLGRFETIVRNRPMIEAFAAGKTIQYNPTPQFKDGIRWADLSNPSFDRPPECYRVKPEPLKPIERWTYQFQPRWTPVQPKYSVVTSSRLFDTAGEAEEYGRRLRRDRFIRVVKLVEVVQ